MPKWEGENVAQWMRSIRTAQMISRLTFTHTLKHGMAGSIRCLFIDFGTQWFRSHCRCDLKEQQWSIHSLNFIYLSITIVSQRDAPPPAPCSGLVMPETSTNTATGTMYIQYLAKKPRLSLTSPRSRASRSRSIFWMNVAVSGLQRDETQEPRTPITTTHNWDGTCHPKNAHCAHTLVRFRMVWWTHRCWTPPMHPDRLACLCCKQLCCPIPTEECPWRRHCNRLISTECHSIANELVHTDHVIHKIYTNRTIKMQIVRRCFSESHLPLSMMLRTLTWYHCDCA